MKPILLVRLPLDATEEDKQDMYKRLVAKVGQHFFIVITGDALKMQSEFEIVR